MWTNERPRGRAPRRPARAFTLLEILVAMAVLSVALMTMYQSFASTVHINTSTRGLWKAMIYANNELARIERGTVLPVAIDQGKFPPGSAMAGYAWRREVVDEQPFPGVRVRKVVLVLEWDLAGVPQSYRSQLYVRSN